MKYISYKLSEVIKWVKYRCMSNCQLYTRVDCITNELNNNDKLSREERFDLIMECFDLLKEIIRRHKTDEEFMRYIRETTDKLTMKYSANL